MCMSARISVHVSTSLCACACDDQAPIVSSVRERRTQVLHIGDDIKKDYLAAKAAGMRALLFDPDGKYSGADSAEQLDASEVIHTLDEVCHHAIMLPLDLEHIGP